ncbi:hypothetical protein PO883_10520 [Massilia sp. DJPM01]|uniref:hypothetical protein n=1 Tax=Massilia sp. DJPM01 TaxID=3024404 RepID=UPI00259EAD54|nr:hypothetical protein [Massilia sp. DJPM01]MDM5177625.1 hypothetical protein [Massilia sp. DJPM01]
MNDKVAVFSQVPVLVTIMGVDKFSEVYYTYADPGTGIHYDKSRTCNINAVSPFQTLFALDYATSRNGWNITKPAERKPTRLPPTSQIVTPLIPSFPDTEAGGFVLITLDFTNLEYEFDLTFYNHITKTTIWDDPQEGNVLQPIKPRDAEPYQAS